MSSGPGYSGALERCLAKLAGSSPAPAPGAPSAPTSSLCVLVSTSVWAGLGAFLFIVGLVTGLSCGACWFGTPRPRRLPVGAEIRPGSFTGPVSPAALRQLQQ